jgi:iron-sulfur cluster repair protein YtfE (RIC family)
MEVDLSHRRILMASIQVGLKHCRLERQLQAFMTECGTADPFGQFQHSHTVMHILLRFHRSLLSHVYWLAQVKKAVVRHAVLHGEEW